jgi:hypothetical protein
MSQGKPEARSAGVIAVPCGVTLQATFGIDRRGRARRRCLPGRQRAGGRHSRIVAACGRQRRAQRSQESDSHRNPSSSHVRYLSVRDPGVTMDGRTKPALRASSSETTNRLSELVYAAIRGDERRGEQVVDAEAVGARHEAVAAALHEARDADRGAAAADRNQTGSALDQEDIDVLPAGAIWTRTVRACAGDRPPVRSRPSLLRVRGRRD